MSQAADTPEIQQDGEWTTTGMLRVCLFVFLGLTAIFLPFSEIDLWAASLFYNGNNDFWLRQTLFNVIKNDYIRPGVGIVAVAGLSYYIYHRLTGRPGKIKKLARYGFLLICIALSTGFVVHAIFKDNFGRARPKQVTEFAGNQEFTPALLPAQQCERNCSFVSGDASLGYVFLALALYATKRRKFWILTTVAAGLGLGLLRMMNGSHFLSDILYSGVFTCGTVLILYRWIVEGHWSEDTGWLGRKLAALAGWIMDIMPLPVTRRALRARVRLRRAARKLS